MNCEADADFLSNRDELSQERRQAGAEIRGSNSFVFGQQGANRLPGVGSFRPRQAGNNRPLQFITPRLGQRIEASSRGGNLIGLVIGFGVLTSENEKVIRGEIGGVE